jgi:hypothetical protein
MTWGYWGIVGGLVALLAVFFVCMEILYPRARRPMEGMTESPADKGKEAASGTKHAA